MINVAAPLDSSPVAGERPILVQLSDKRGWDLIVEVDGKSISIDHCTDWHRVERRLALLSVRARRDGILSPLVAACLIASVRRSRVCREGGRS